MVKTLKQVIDAKVTIGECISQHEDEIHSILDIVRLTAHFPNFVTILRVLSIGEYFDDGGFRFPSTEKCCGFSKFRLQRHFVLIDKFTTKTFEDGLYTPGDKLYKVDREGKLIRELQLDDVCVSSKRRKSKT